MFYRVLALALFSLFTCQPGFAAWPEEALEGLARASEGPSRILVCGSLYLAGRVLAAQQG